MLSKYCATQLLLALLLLLVERQIENGNPSSRCFYFHQVLYTAHFDSVSRTFIVPLWSFWHFLLLLFIQAGRRRLHEDGLLLSTGTIKGKRPGEGQYLLRKKGGRENI